jgi:hypothetical protein
MPPLPPLNLTGGAATAKGGDLFGGDSGFGNVNFGKAGIDWTVIAILAAVVAVLVLKK